MMTPHLLILPVLIPLLTGALLLLLHRAPMAFKRGLSLLGGGLLLPISVLLLLWADDGQLQVYALGNWQPPFGIMLLLDRLSALMLVVNAILAAAALVYACRGSDEQGPNFHALFHFQLLGINGAFLTGDLFNLFVFFEILLIASYALLVHGNDARKVRAGLHYVVLNLLGSSLFLIGVSALYGLTGTLNMADLAVKVAELDPADAPLVEAAGLLLLVVFGLKAAMLPLHFWLPRTYAAAPAPVAALFAIMTKVGLYALLRVFTLIYGSEAGSLAHLADDWLWPLALLTLALGAIGALAAREIQQMLGYLIVVSVGTLLAGLASGSLNGMAAALYYLVHSTLVGGGLFLLADLILRQRGDTGGALIPGQPLRQPLLLGTLFFFGAIAVVGLPPLSGFLGKLMLLQAVSEGSAAVWLWTVILLSGLVMLIALSRVGSLVFWSGTHVEASGEAAPMADPVRLLACGLLLLSSLGLMLAAAPLQAYAQATVEQLLNLTPYLQIVTGEKT